MSAVLSPCGLYRHRLDRDVQMDGIVVALCGVNPSTADATINDATIRKDMGFARVNGWRRIIKFNVFGFRATDVTALAKAADPYGPENDRHVHEIIAEADLIVPCWGSRNKLPKHLRPAMDRMRDLLLTAGKPVLVFGLAKSGDPLHPLMLGYDTKLVPWMVAAPDGGEG